MAFNRGKESKRRSDQDKPTKSKYESKSITRIVVSLFIAIVAFVGATYYESYLLSDKNVTTVVVAAADVKAGTLIDKTNVDTYFKTKEVNASLATKSTIKDIKDVTGKTIVDITKDEIITTQRFADTRSNRDKFKNPVMITYRVSDPVYAVGGSVREGDIIDILETTSSEDGSNVESTVLVKGAYVLKAMDVDGNVIDRDNTDASAVAFTFYVERDEEANFDLNTHPTLSISKVVLSSKAEKTSK